MTERIRFYNRKEWLEGRRAMNGIGGSEAPAVLGDSKFMSRLELWRLKTGAAAPKDLSDNPAVARGVRMEGAVRGWFKACHPELRVYHHPYDILYQTERPWLFATLDGETVDRETGELGIVEIKNAEPRGREGWAEWDGRVPDQYYDQILHQHLATRRRRIWLVAALWSMSGDVTIREYEWRVDDGFILDAQAVLSQEERFMGWVRDGIMPPTPIRL